MRTYKKAGLSLSVNAIVVLVLAITMLGLGIAFTRNMFTSLENRLMDGIDYENVPNPSVANPIAMESTNVNVPAGGNTAFGMKILNTRNEPVHVNVTHGDNSRCANLTHHSEGLLEFIPRRVEDVGVGEIAEVAGIIRAANNETMRERNQIMGCPILVHLSNSTHHVLTSFSTTIRISTR